MVYTTGVRLESLLLLGLAAPWLLLGQKPVSRDLTDASLEDLMNLVTSVFKKEQKLSKTGAAGFVITQGDIHRSGATNIPDLLRMVPGADVAQVDANKWLNGAHAEFHHAHGLNSIFVERRAVAMITWRF